MNIKELFVVWLIALLVFVLFAIGVYHAKRLHGNAVEFIDFCAWSVSVGATDTDEYKKICEEVSI